MGWASRPSKRMAATWRESGSLPAWQLIERAPATGHPSSSRSGCMHMEGHFLGYQLLRVTQRPLREMPGMAIPLTRSFLRPGTASLRKRLAWLRLVASTLLATLRDPRRDSENDPVMRTRIALGSDTARLREMEDRIEREISDVLSSALQEHAP